MSLNCRAGLLVVVAAVSLAACSTSTDSGAASEPSTLPGASTRESDGAAPRQSAPSSTVPPSTVQAPAGATVVQPAQPTSGPGGATQPHGDVRVSSGGVGVDAWYVFEPASPQPASAPVAVVLHGYYEFDGYPTMEELLLHTARTGSVVIYPRWQTGVADPCPGPYDAEACVESAVAGIKGALEYLQADQRRVQPQVDSIAYFGLSFGGILTTTLANRHDQLGLPPPSVIFLDDPHDSGMVAPGEPTLDRPLDGIPASTLITCHVSEHGAISEVGKADSSCNALFPLLDHIPPANKALVMTRADDHGQPPLTAPHGVCAAPAGNADAYDWNVCWRIWDALRSAASDGSHREVALGGGPTHRDNGTWSDGTPVTPLEVAKSAPIRP